MQKGNPMKWFIPTTFIVCIILLTGCATRDSSPPESPEVFAPASEQGGQIPADIVQQASMRHGGSMTESVDSAGQVSPQDDGRITVVLGPVNAEQLEQAGVDGIDAGQSIRETISQRLTAENSVTLFDAPQERFIDDSPRPDLARRGVRFVVKGVVSSSTVSREITVFLRAVNTASGKVAMVASARDASRNQAAVEAADRLIKKLTGTQP
jgi:hypothetical protein